MTLASRGNASLKAFRLTSSFLAARKKKQFDTQGSVLRSNPFINFFLIFISFRLVEHRLTFSNILEELPVVIRSSALLTAFLSKLVESPAPAPLPTVGALAPASDISLLPSFSHLDLTSPAQLTRHMEAVIETLDSYKTEEGNLAYLSRQIARERLKADTFIAKRRDENAARVVQGLAPLPEEDVSRLFKIPPEPSRLESMVLMGQLDGYTKSLEASAGSSLVKMYAAQAGTSS